MRYYLISRFAERANVVLTMDQILQSKTNNGLTTTNQQPHSSNINNNTQKNNNQTNNIVQLSQIQSTTSTQNGENQNNRTFAQALKKSNFYENDKQFYPRKEHGIIISSGKDIKLHEYIECVAELVGADNVIFASRLSMDRIGMYLKSIDIVETLTDKFNTIVINNLELPIRPLITKAKKFFLSRVSPIIPNSYLHEEIEKLNFVKITSPIQMVKVGCEKRSLSHVLSYRRIFFGLLEKNANIPDYLLIEYEGETHKIFISDKIKKCTVCQKYGHVSENCEQMIQENTESSSEIIFSGFDDDITINNTIINQLSESQMNINDAIINELKNEIIDEISTDDEIEENVCKKQRSSSGTEVPIEDLSLNQIRAQLNESKYETKITLEQLQNFIQSIYKCKSNEQIGESLQGSGIQLSLWDTVFEDLRPICSPKMKNKFTRIQRKLKLYNLSTKKISKKSSLKFSHNASNQDSPMESL